MTDTSTDKIERLPSSLRDPAGFIFEHNGKIYRAVNHSYKKHFDLLLSSGLYDKLVSKDMLIDHQEVDPNSLQTSVSQDIYKLLEVKRLPFISYPFEWCFSQLKNAALLTLEIQLAALEQGMTLKDASAYNIQFLGEKAIFIDTLSFEEHVEGNPWIAYGQFCGHFLAPLALMSYRDDRLGSLLKNYMDGLPLDLAADLLPLRSWLNLSLLWHLVMHSKAQYIFQEGSEIKQPQIKSAQLKSLIETLHDLIKGLKVKRRGSVWADYYASECNYSEKAMDSKYRIVEGFVNKVKPKMVWDLGSNDGKFSRIASSQNIFTVAMDGDHNSTENNYLNCQKEGNKYLLPLLIDLINPSPAQGWAHCETKSLMDRGPVDLMLVLAVVHHLVITHSLSLLSIAKSLADLCNWLVIEFIPSTDSQIKRLLQSHSESHFNERYNESIFEAEFSKFFILHEKIQIEESNRIMYLFQTKSTR